MHSWRFMLHTFSCWRTRSGPPGVTPPARSRAGGGVGRTKRFWIWWLARGGGCLGYGTRMQSGCRRRGDKTWRGITAPRFSDQSGAMRLSPHRRAETQHQSQEGEGRGFLSACLCLLNQPQEPAHIPRERPS